MKVDLTRIEGITIFDIKKFEKHSEKVLDLIREHGYEEVTTYTAYGETFELSIQYEPKKSFDKRLDYKPRSYKKQVTDFLDEFNKIEKEFKFPEVKETPKKKPSTFDLANEIQLIIEKGAEVETEEEMNEMIVKLETTELALKDKLERVVLYAKDKQRYVDSIDARIKELNAKKKSAQSKVDSMNTLGGIILDKLGETKIETLEGDIKYNTGEAVEVTGQVPQEFIKHTVKIEVDSLLTGIQMDFDLDQEEIEEFKKFLFGGNFVTETIKKAEIKKAIKGGRELDFACILKTKKGVIK